MISLNYIYLNPADLDKPIYRIIPASRFIQILATNKSTLVKPKKWDDPFENALLLARLRLEQDCTAGFMAKVGGYGQCWTWHSETDAMWRIYSPNKDGVRLMTTPRKLLTSLKNVVGERCFIGSVQYKQKTALPAYFADINVFDASGDGMAKSLLCKKIQFRHEAEVRLIYCADESVCQGDVFSYDISPNHLFDRVLFDPRMDRAQRSFHIEVLRCLGCTSEIKRSTVYDAPSSLKFTLPRQ